ncbi:MAG: FAD-binding oxidoreductase [Thermoplasmata archaeon]
MKLYCLWGDENKGIKVNKKFYNFIYEKFGIDDNKIVWDGHYVINELEKNEDLEKLLKECLKDKNISFDTKDRFYHSFGKSGFDYITLMENSNFRIVDAVIYPNEEEIPCIFEKLKNECEIIIYGGGTSVTGGIAPSGRKKFSIALDTMNLNYFNVDEKSMILEAGTGIKGPDLENRLKKFGLTLGNFPESFEYSTLGGWIATNAAGQESNRYGKIKDMVLGVTMVSPSGTFSDKKAPAESAFFRVSDIAIGSEGTYGVITRAYLKVHKIPKKLYFKAYIFKNFLDGLESLRKIITNGKIPLVSRLSDEIESKLSLIAIEDNAFVKIFKTYLKMRGVLNNGSILIVVNDSKIPKIDGINLGSMPSKFWLKSRYDRPYMYNELLKHGIVAETIETSTVWSNAYSLYRNVTLSFNDTLEKNGVSGLIMCHASHEYLTGTALYFTFIFYSKDERKKYLTILRNAVIKSIIESGGSISHHHGIGTYLGDELKSYKGNAYNIIKALKNNLDPDNMLNSEIIK